MNYSDVTYGALEVFVENDFVRHCHRLIWFPFLRDFSTVTDEMIKHFSIGSRDF